MSLKLTENNCSVNNLFYMTVCTLILYIFVNRYELMKKNIVMSIWFYD